MKKIMLSLASILFVGVVAVNAQVTQDTTRTSQSGTTGTTGQTGTSGATGTESETSYQRDMVEIQPNEVPASLRSTLQGSEYQGWEDGTVYRNKTTNEYAVEVGEGTNKKTYRFDRNGKRMGDTGSGTSPDDNN